MTDMTYRAAWLAYIFASSGVAWVCWHLFCPHVRCRSWQLVLPLLAFLLTPYFSDPTQSRLAPAILTVLFEGVFGNPEIAAKAVIPLAGVLLVTLAAALLARKKSAPTT